MTGSTATRPSLLPQDWPYAECSRLVRCSGITWHLQEAGQGPTLILLHGTGASTHSWRKLVPLLHRDWHVVMVDLPGHGYTTPAGDRCMSLTGMSTVLGDLFNHLSLRPHALIGHSAGAALACQLVLDQWLSVKRVISINGALKPFDGMPGHLFGAIARAMSASALIPSLVSWRVNKSDRMVERLLHDTGSTIDAEGRQWYADLLRRKTHVAGALSMMAHWNLEQLWHRLPALATPMNLLAGTRDKTILPRQSSEVSHYIDSATLTLMPGLGHLAHEEAPDIVYRHLHKALSTNTTADNTAHDQSAIRVTGASQ